MFAQSDHEETGNLVPSGKEVPAGVEVKNVYVVGATLVCVGGLTWGHRQSRANSKCFYTYVFDTYFDQSLYEGQWVSERSIL